MEDKRLTEYTNWANARTIKCKRKEEALREWHWWWYGEENQKNAGVDISVHARRDGRGCV